MIANLVALLDIQSYFLWYLLFGLFLILIKYGVDLYAKNFLKTYKIYAEISGYILFLIFTFIALVSANFFFTDESIYLTAFNAFIAVAFVIQTIWTIAKVILDVKIDDLENKDLKTLYIYIFRFGIAFLWIIGILFVIANLGFDITSLVAGLGVGGIAVALAVQNSLTGIVSAFIIIVTRPFRIGDYVKLNADEAGTITNIGLHSTTLKTIDNLELIIPNQDILNSRIFNYRTRRQIRNTFDIHLALSTTDTKINKFMKFVEETFETLENCDEKKSKVIFNGQSEFSFKLNVIFYTRTKNYAKFLNTKEEFFLNVYNFARRNKIELAKNLVNQSN